MFSWLVNPYSPLWGADMWEKIPNEAAAAAQVVALARRPSATPRGVTSRGSAIAAGALWLLAAERWENFNGYMPGMLPDCMKGQDWRLRAQIFAQANVGFFAVPDAPKFLMPGYSAAIAHSFRLADISARAREQGAAWAGVQVCNGWGETLGHGWRVKSHKRPHFVYLERAVLVGGLNLSVSDRRLLGWSL